MRKNKFAIALLLTLTGCFWFAQRSAAQSAPAFELGGNYTFVRANAGPGACGCINMQGGGGWGSYNLTGSLGIVGEVAAQHASNIGPLAADLTLTYFLAGVRYKPRPARTFVPFVQVLLGGAHASGDMAPVHRAFPALRMRSR